MFTEKVLPWTVHLFTASGLLAGFLSILAINRGDWRGAMAWLLVALVIDGVDGTLARVFKVKEKLPHMNGKMIDTVVDFTNYAVVPAYLIYASGVLDPVLRVPAAFVILLVSALYYGKEGMVSSDFYFKGFPVMWNVVAFYLIFVFEGSTALPDPALQKTLNSAIIVFLAVLHFVPVKFAYPSRATRKKIPTLAATFSILLVMPLAVWMYPNVPAWLKIAALLNLSYFAVLALLDTVRDW